MLDLVLPSRSAIDYLAAVPSRAEMYVLCGAAYAVLVRHDRRIGMLNRRLTRLLSAMSGVVRADRAHGDQNVGQAGPVQSLPSREPPLTRRFLSEFVEAMQSTVVLRPSAGSSACPAPGPHFAFGIMPDRPVTGAAVPPRSGGDAIRRRPAVADLASSSPLAPIPVTRHQPAQSRPAEPAFPAPTAARPVAMPEHAPAEGGIAPARSATSPPGGPAASTSGLLPASGLPGGSLVRPSHPAATRLREAEPPELDELGAGLSSPLGLKTVGPHPDEGYAEAYRLSLAARIGHERRLQQLLIDRTQALARRTAAAEPTTLVKEGHLLRAGKVETALRDKTMPPWSWSAAFSTATDPCDAALSGVSP